jgi:hypothetical protein
MHRALIALLSLLMLHGTAAAQGQRRLAFVVGIEDYRDLSPQGQAAVAECIGRACDGGIAELDGCSSDPAHHSIPLPELQLPLRHSRSLRRSHRRARRATLSTDGGSEP